ncbi:hypothetical protein E3N88_27578 [Mikania micrantha]|uniref:Uncharacterized protein n=1 Tax=Mikania micrantha TaxID=192012 RepID=A0A5N6MY72_9ASTR|nr:hypothetical protein E3N88_27578 [Mikania micrantha]
MSWWDGDFFFGQYSDVSRVAETYQDETGAQSSEAINRPALPDLNEDVAGQTSYWQFDLNKEPCDDEDVNRECYGGEQSLPPQVTVKKEEADIVYQNMDWNTNEAAPFSIAPPPGRPAAPPLLRCVPEPDVRSYAGRSKKKEGGTSTGRIEGNAELRREAKRNARRKSKKLAENLFYRLKNPHGNYPNNFSEEELQMIGLGYDRMVQFMEKDDPNLKHPYDWYKYGEFGPYSWRGVVLGEPIRGRFSDENVTLIGEVRDQEEWEKIEQFEMSQDFGQRLDLMDKNVGFKYFWVFVRHPKWRVSDLPWEQWTLVSEVVVEAGKQRLDKWNLMGRLGNRTRSLITKCAAWMRPDVIYVKRPVYQCRFEPQDEFFKSMAPLLDPETEQDFLCQLEREDGGVEMCTYFGGLCKILRVNPKAFVDDVVRAFEKASDEKKSKCLEFLLGNHPIELLHPYTKEWKAKLEEMDNEEMEVIARRSVKMTTKLYEKHSLMMEGKRMKQKLEDENNEGEMVMRRGRAKISQDEWKQLGYDPRTKKIKRSKIPPGQFLRAAVRPFMYKNLVKEIVLTRHAIIEGEIGSGKKN